jgi:hypothetical protein
VYGEIDPIDEVQSCVIFSGHHDSAHIYNFFEDFPAIFMVRELLFFSMFIVSTIYLSVATASRFESGDLWQPQTRSEFNFAIGFTVALIFVLPMWFYLNKNGTPGAGDNMISTAVAFTLAEYFGVHRLKHTRLMFVSFDAEEIGLRGSHAFFAKHKSELHEVNDKDLS